METFVYKKRPRVNMVIADWKRADRPASFEVEVGETFAVFERQGNGRWFAHGNGCRGVDRDGVEEALNLIQGFGAGLLRR